MALNNNIFYVSNPANIMDGLWKMISESNIDLENILIFLPNRRSVRSVEKMIVNRVGHAVILPKLIALGEGLDSESDETDECVGSVSILERMVMLAYLLSSVPTVGTIATALPVAKTLITMQDYLENSGVDASKINWTELVDERYAEHFVKKAELLNILSNPDVNYFNGRKTETQIRNESVLAWCDYVKKMPVDKSLIIVCGSTASVPVTAKLMSVIANLPNGRIILSGKISGSVDDFVLDTNPYNSEYRFLSDLGLSFFDVSEIDVGVSHIDFMNKAFGNSVDNNHWDLSNCHLVECATESEEAAAVAEIAKRAISEKKSVLVITPDAAGNQRIANEFLRCGINADFSGGVSGATTLAGRALLNLFDYWLENGKSDFDDIYANCNYDLFDTISVIVQNNFDDFTPQFCIDEKSSIQVWEAIKKLSDCLINQKIKLDLLSARAFIVDCLSGISIRNPLNNDAPVVVLGTIESRMQTADVVILTGLNDGMFPATGYENPWIPKDLAKRIGLPSPNHKVSLMALDFMNLSCNPTVYWLRSCVSGGVKTMESRFISRVMVGHGDFDKEYGCDILKSVRNRDNVESKPLVVTAPQPPADWSDVYVTELELLIHNPYAFYVRHILRLNVIDDYWVGPDARIFGTLVHSVLEKSKPGVTPDVLVGLMDAKTREILGNTSLLFHFWHKRFIEIAPALSDEINRGSNTYAEVFGRVKIAGRNVCAKADGVWDGGVFDLKTGEAPSRKKLNDATKPQLPLEAFILQQGGFKNVKTTIDSKTPVMRFLQLKSGAVKAIEYDFRDTKTFMDLAVLKVGELFNMYSAGGAAYEYHINGAGEIASHAYDDLARVEELD